MAQCADYASWPTYPRFSPLVSVTMATEESHPPLLRKHSQLGHVSSAARCPNATALLLSSPLPPELVVALKSSSSASAAVASPALLRPSCSETDVHQEQYQPGTGNAHKTVFQVESVDIPGRRPLGYQKLPLTRTCSEGLQVSYRSSGQNKPRRKLESEDSSYDSDYECSLAESPSKRGVLAAEAEFSETSEPPSEHGDVSRTVSDTLGQEFSEYVSLNPVEPMVHAVASSEEHKSEEEEEEEEDEEEYEDEEEEDALSSPDPSYTSKVEFAVKLGYTEEQVRTVLNKLGAQPSQNELLAELIRIAALAPPTSHNTPVAGRTLHRLASSIEEGDQKTALREEGTLKHIVIDGSNVAMSHGNKERFSCRGIQICVDWFRARGHKDITVFVPKWRKEASRPEAPISDQEVLLELEKCGILVFTPSRLVGGRRLVCYDDRYILRLALEVDGVVVSNDNYRDLAAENPDFRRVVQDRILMYSFVNDRFMPPEDPLGRSGPSLDQFLSKKSSSNAHQPPCPYGKKCTYGNKCKYFHPERGSQPQKSVTERLAEQSQKHMQELKLRSSNAGAHARVTDDQKKSLSVPLTHNPDITGARGKTPLTRTRSVATQQATPPLNNYSDAPAMSKSKSVENVAVSARLSPLKSLPGGHTQRGLSVWPEGSNNAGTELDPPTAEPNAHRKVNRQLTLNPSYDPRLYRFHRPLPYCNDFPTVAPPPFPPPASIPPPLTHSSRFEHAHVTRNASAPDAFWSADRNGGNPPAAYLPRFAPPVPPIQRLNSTSDTQLNRYCGGSSSGSTASVTSDVFQDWTSPAPWQQQQQQPAVASRTASVPLGPPPTPSYLDSRAKLYYHLAAIFPPEEVRQALLMFPDECNPQKICAAILNLFPPKGV